MTTQQAVIWAARFAATSLLALPMIAGANPSRSEEPSAPVVLRVYSDYV
jgi:hypothetical protein